MRVNLFSTFILVIGSLILFSCTKDQVNIEDYYPANCIDTISYATQVEPILNQSCATSNCHDDMTSAAGYNLTNHFNVSTNANIILSVIRHQIVGQEMPIGAPKLSDNIAQQIDCWISQGKLDN